MQNLTIDGLQFPKYAFSYKYLGGLAGYIENGTFSNIALDTIEGFNGENSSSGGFAGEINSGTFNNISLKNLGNIGVAKYAGGFAGQINGGDFSSIILSNIESIYGKNNGGGFVGYTTGNTTFDGIGLKDIRFIKSGAFTGGFAGMT